MKAVIRVLLVDDHRMFAEALEMLLAGAEGIEVTGAVATAEEALEAVARIAPDVHGIEATRKIREMSETTRVVIITAFQEPALMAQAIEAGACGFVPKTQAADQLVRIVRQAASGEITLPAGQMRTVLAQLQEAHRVRSDGKRLLGQLTGREIQVIQGIADGTSTAELANFFHISPFTVQTHVKNILAKLGVHSKLEAVVFALRHDLIRVRNQDLTGRPRD